MDTPHRKLVLAIRFIFKKLTKSVRVTAFNREAVVLLFESGKLIAWPFSKGRNCCVTRNILLVTTSQRGPKDKVIFQRQSHFGGMLLVAVNLLAKFLGWGSKRIIDNVNASRTAEPLEGCTQRSIDRD